MASGWAFPKERIKHSIKRNYLTKSKRRYGPFTARLGVENTEQNEQHHPQTSVYKNNITTPIQIITWANNTYAWRVFHDIQSCVSPDLQAALQPTPRCSFHAVSDLSGWTVVTDAVLSSWKGGGGSMTADGKNNLLLTFWLLWALHCTALWSKQCVLPFLLLKYEEKATDRADRDESNGCSVCDVTLSFLKLGSYLISRHLATILCQLLLPENSQRSLKMGSRRMILFGSCQSNKQTSVAVTVWVSHLLLN